MELETDALNLTDLERGRESPLEDSISDEPSQVTLSTSNSSENLRRNETGTSNDNAAPTNPPQDQRLLIIRYTGILTIWRRSCIFFLCYFIPIVIAIIGVLIADWNGSCNRPLRTWLFVLAMLHTLMAVLNIRVYLGLPTLSDSADVQVQRFLDVFWLIWFIMGTAWTFTSECEETAPHMSRMAISLFAIQLAFAMGVVFFCCFSCCGLVHQIAAAGERAPGGASKKLIQSLRSKKFDVADVKAEDASCAICLCEYEKEELIRYLPCNHHFHSDCVDQWLRMNKSCPLCKKEIDDKQEPVKKSEPLNQDQAEVAPLVE